MKQYPREGQADEVNNEANNRRVQPQQLSRTGEVKRSFDFLITTPGMLRKGVARHGDALQGFVDYNIKLFRSEDRKWMLYLEWVDLDGDGHRIVLPHEVMQGVLQRANSIIAQSRKERAQRGANTRRRKRDQELESKVK